MKRASLLLISMMCLHCAGPMTPFGGLPFAEKLFTDSEDGETSKAVRNPTIEFSPRRQILHSPSDLLVRIQDPSGVPNDFKIKVIYNKFDVSKQFLNQANLVRTNNPNEVLLQFKDLTILPDEDNDIRVIYQREKNKLSASSRFLPPKCNLDQKRSIASTGDFEASPEVIALLQANSALGDLNPAFLAGLVAQESGFDPLTVSWSKAIGLTQITSQGEAEVLKMYPNWPRYSNLDDLPVLAIRAGILTGKINGTNEWRLNPTYSVAGGVAYLRYLQQYWQREETQNLIHTFFEDDQKAESELILASYNSGPARVSQTLKKKGAGWLKSPELKSARRYVGRVQSFCDHFGLEKEGGENENKTKAL